MSGEKLTPITNKPSLWALSPLLVFLCLYLVTSIIVDDFYKVPITVAFMVSSVYAVCITKGLSLNERMLQYSIGAANKNIMLMIWIFVLAGAFAQSAKDIGAIDATVNLTLTLLPDNLLLAGIFLAACFISLSIGTSVGTIVALVPVVAGIADKTEMNPAPTVDGYSNSSNSFCKRPITSSIGTSLPNSFCKEVTPLSINPQGWI